MSELFEGESAAGYDDGWARLAPLVGSIHLVAFAAFDRLPPDARVLCVGSGTGAEIAALAARFPGFTFVAVDPAEAMMAIARAKLTELGVADRCTFHVGTVDTLPPSEPFAAATAILVSHFLVDREARVGFFRAIAERLAPGAPFVSADLAAPNTEGGLGALWDGLLRYVGLDAQQIAGYRALMGPTVALLPADAVERLVTEGGFAEVTHAFQAVWMHAWVAHRG
jgi:tRNA (cmo5U34)-methyltransferase